MAKATFAAGCFWGVEDAFRQVKGVTSTAVGYTGGTKVNPSYKDVCSGTTGHAEAVEVDFNPAEVSYLELLAAFWKSHDPQRSIARAPILERNTARPFSSTMPNRKKRLGIRRPSWRRKAYSSGRL
jgi:methionine-S-sulfoxide reductase